MMFEAILCGVDRVLVDSPHERAWGETLCALMQGEWAELQPFSDWTPDAYTSDLYHDLVAGRPRAEGARALLRHFSITDEEARVDQMCALKQEAVRRLIQNGEFEAHRDAVMFLLRAKASGMKIVAVSSSRNAGEMLKRVPARPFLEEAGIAMVSVAEDASLTSLLDGYVAYPGDPVGATSPNRWLAAAEKAEAAPGVCLALAGTPSGVRAAGEARIRCVGVARRADEHLYRAAGADWVLTTLQNLDPANLNP